MGSCGNGGSTRWFYTGNQVGDLNHTGDFNATAGGPPGTGIAAGALVAVFFPPPVSRSPWLNGDASLSQSLLDACFPFIELVWIADITLPDGTLYRVSDRNVYVQDDDGAPRFYEARVKEAPSIRITLGEWLNPKLEIGDLSLTLNNRDGFFSPKLPQGNEYLQWTGTTVRIAVGFGEKRSNYFDLFTGSIPDRQGVTSTETEVKIRVYDSLDTDDVPLPVNVFNRVAFPDVQDEALGKPVPLIYGDWTEEVGEFGEIPAWLINANEDVPTEWTLKLCDNALTSVDGLYLQRGNRNSAHPDGPIEIDLQACTIDLSRGEVTVPFGSPSFLTESVILASAKAGTGSGLNLITAEGDSNFVKKGIQEGDTVVKFDKPTFASVTVGPIQYFARISGPAGNGLGITVTIVPIAPSQPIQDPIVNVLGLNTTVIVEERSDDPMTDKDEADSSKRRASKVASAINKSGSPLKAVVLEAETYVNTFGLQVTANGSLASQTPATVQTVTNGQLIMTGGVTFAAGDAFGITSVRYKYTKGDKITARCVGKNVQQMSINRLVDAGLGSVTAAGLSLDLDGNYWFADNASQKIYAVSLRNVIVHQIPYASIGAGITEITGVSWQTDQSIWVFDKPLSKVFRYHVDQGGPGISFTTVGVAGLGVALGDGRGLTIDEGNMLYIVNNTTGTFYKINPFAPVQPTLVTSWNRTAFDAAATETLDLSADVNLLNLSLVDRQTQKVYRINRTTGALISSFPLSLVSVDIDFVSGLSIAQDGTLFVIDRTDRVLINYNEDSDASFNPGFIARDLIQSYTGKVATDFDLKWNQTSRENMSKFRARLYLGDKSSVIKEAFKLLGQFSAVVFPRFARFALFYIHFDNFIDNGDPIREGDIKEDSFEPTKEWNQYFNSVACEYRDLPYSGKNTASDSYISPSGLAAAGKEVTKKIDAPSIYRRIDVDTLMPVFVRLAAAEPEFVKFQTGFRLLFTQLMDFFRINFDARTDCNTGLRLGGRRFNLVPCYVRELTYNLSGMTLSWKVWSLGTTRFGDYQPAGAVAGGEGDKIVLTPLGSYAYVSPTGTVLSSTVSSVTLQDVSGQNAQVRTAPIVGLAWAPGYVVAIVNGANHQVVETAVIGTVVLGVINFTAPLATTVLATVKNQAGFVTSGHYLRHANYSEATTTQKDNFAFFGPPSGLYPPSGSKEIEEQKAGIHNFPDGRPPYLLYPEAFTPT